MAKALYRTYRSRSLDEVVGQEHVTNVLRAAIKHGKISHAYLLTGPRGVGKTSVARIMAHAINQLPYSDDTHLDIIEIDAASNRRIDDIRDLRDKVHIAPASAKYKVYIIDEVHMLTGESFNALLKTLEEPPSHVVFILATTELHKVPATIISRTQRFHFRPASPAALAAHLKMIAQKEAIKIDNAALELIAERGDGSFRDSISLLDQLASLSDHITTDLIESTLGLAPSKLVNQLTTSVLARDSKKIIDHILEIEQQGIPAVTLSEQLISKLSIEGRAQPQLFQLIDKLLSVKGSYDPLMKLTAVLVDWAKPAKTTPMRTAVTPTATFVAPLKKAKGKPQPVTDESPSDSKAAPATAVLPPASTSTNAEAAIIDWDKVMSTLKSRHTPLHSVVSRAEMEQSGNSITLTFTYALHRKKLENNLYRNQLASVIEHTCGIIPEIIVASQTKPKLEPTVETKAVADIMGGGELVDAR